MLVLSLLSRNISAQTLQRNVMPDFSTWEIYNPQANQKPKRRLFSETPRNGLNHNGLVGLFVSESAENLESGRLFTGIRLSYHELTSRRGKSYWPNEKGSVTSTNTSVAYIGEWAEWSITVPVHKWDLSAGRTYNYPRAREGNGMGNIKLGWKANYLPDKSYYRFAYGAVAEVTTGDYEAMQPTGSRTDDELKLFGVVTTRESDYVTGNFEMGVILNSRGVDNRFIYRFGMSYEASRHAALIGELVGDVQSGNGKDTMDLVAGIRLSPTRDSILQFVFYRNIRTYREFGWDTKLEIGTTTKW